MKLALFHLAAYVVVGVVSLPPEGQYCSVFEASYLHPNDPFGTYGGSVKPAGKCLGLPTFADTFAAEALTRSLPNVAITDLTLACCLEIKCGPQLNGYCTSKGNACNGGVDAYYAASWCPGSYSQCCPDPEYVKPRASTNDDTNFLAQENLASPDIITGGEEIGLGNSNLEDWTAYPLESENLLLADDNTNDYGLIAAGLGDLTAWDVDNTASFDAFTKP